MHQSPPRVDRPSLSCGIGYVEDAMLKASPSCIPSMTVVRSVVGVVTLIAVGTVGSIVVSVGVRIMIRIIVWIAIRSVVGTVTLTIVWVVVIRVVIGVVGVLSGIRRPRVLLALKIALKSVTLTLTAIGSFKCISVCSENIICRR